MLAANSLCRQRGDIGISRDVFWPRFWKRRAHVAGAEQESLAWSASSKMLLGGGASCVPPVGADRPLQAGSFLAEGAGRGLLGAARGCLEPLQQGQPFAFHQILEFCPKQSSCSVGSMRYCCAVLRSLSSLLSFQRVSPLLIFSPLLI